MNTVTLPHCSRACGILRSIGIQPNNSREGRMHFARTTFPFHAKKLDRSVVRTYASPSAAEVEVDHFPPHT